MQRPKRITIADVAARAGVCKATVSLALRNHPSIPPPTADLVRRVAAEMDYRPDPFVAALMANRRRNRPLPQSAVIAYVSGYSATDTKLNSFLRRHHDGAKQRALQLGYKLEFFSLRSGEMSARRLSQILFSRSIYGVLIGPFPEAHARVKLDWVRVAPATIGFHLEDPPMSRVDNDHVHNVTTAVRELQALGYQRIGLCMYAGGEELAQFRNRMSFLNYQFSLPPRRRVPIFEPARFDREAVLEWYAKHRPDVILSVNSEVCDWLGAAGIKVPHDVGFASLNLAEEAVGRLSGILNNYEQVAASAIDLIEESLHRNERGLPASPKLIVMNGTWVEGKSTRAAKDANSQSVPSS